MFRYAYWKAVLGKQDCWYTSKHTCLQTRINIFIIMSPSISISSTPSIVELMVHPFNCLIRDVLSLSMWWAKSHSRDKRPWHFFGSVFVEHNRTKHRCFASKEVIFQETSNATMLGYAYPYPPSWLLMNTFCTSVRCHWSKAMDDFSHVPIDSCPTKILTSAKTCNHPWYHP